MEQSHNLIYDLKTNEIRIKKYFELDKKEFENNEEKSIEEYKKQLNRSIELRLRSDVQVGTCLSGGLDSSSIAAIASKKYFESSKKKFTAIHAKSTEKKSDESIFAQEVSEYCNIVEPSKKEFIDKIDEVIYTQEEPFGSPSIFMQYFVMQKAQEIGCTVMLDGQGGDETLLGYERYYPAYLMSLSLIGFIKGFLNASKNSKLSLKELVQYFVYFTSAKIRLKRLYKKSNYLKEEFFSKINKEMVEENAKSYLTYKK